MATPRKQAAWDVPVPARQRSRRTAALLLEYWYYHPYARVLVATGISACNFWMYGEDPVAHSHSQAELPVIGQGWQLLFMRYPPGWRHVAKLIWMFIFLWIGMIVGRTVVHHWLLRDFLKLEMFGWRHTDLDDVHPRCERKVCYCPCQRNTPHNRIFWHEPLQKKVGGDYVLPPELRRALRSVDPPKSPTFGDLVEHRKELMKAPADEPWRTREAYQAGENREQTAVEVWFPCICHPKKHEWASKGSWMITFWTTVFVLYFGALLWNGIFISGQSPSYRSDWELGMGLGMKNRLFMKLAATGTWLGDLFTAIMVIDGMLQELGRHVSAIRAAGAPPAPEPPPAHSSPDGEQGEAGAGAEGGGGARGAPGWERAREIAARFRYYRPGHLRRLVTRTECKEQRQEEAAETVFAKDEVYAVLNAIILPARRFKMGFLRELQWLAQAWDKKLGPLPGTLRVWAVWFVFVWATVIVCVGFYADIFKWDDWAEGVNGTSEAQRALLAAVITMMDLIIVMHDWEFPAFDTPQDVKFPGVEVTELNCGCMDVSVQQKTRDGEPETGIRDSQSLTCCRTRATGKWFNYGIIFCVMGLDLNMLKNQIIYEPAAFGQYVIPDRPELCSTPQLQKQNTRECQIGKVCWIQDRDLADELVDLWALESERPTGADGIPLHPFNFSYEYRQVRLGLRDKCMPSRYELQSLAAKMAATIPAMFGGVWFFYWVWSYSSFDKTAARRERGWFGGARWKMAAAEDIDDAVAAEFTDLKDVARALGLAVTH